MVAPEGTGDTKDARNRFSRVLVPRPVYGGGPLTDSRSPDKGLALTHGANQETIFVAWMGSVSEKSDSLDYADSAAGKGLG